MENENELVGVGRIRLVGVGPYHVPLRQSAEESRSLGSTKRFSTVWRPL